MTAPHRRGRKRPQTQDGRPLRRYKRRWKIERLMAWFGNFRRLIVRYERHPLNYLGFVHLGCILILLRRVYEMACSALVFKDDPKRGGAGVASPIPIQTAGSISILCHNGGRKKKQKGESRFHLIPWRLRFEYVF